jgi:hypothetical protein
VGKRSKLIDIYIKLERRRQSFIYSSQMSFVKLEVVVPMLSSIKNDLIEIVVDTYGAELTSIKTVKDSLEFL